MLNHKTPVSSTGWMLMLTLSLCIAAATNGFMKPPAQAQQLPLNGSAYQNQQSIAGQAAAGPENVMIILDDSDSMADSIDGTGEPKMSAAKRTVLEVLKSISPSTRVGLRIYGNSASPFTACHATTVLVPLGENNRNLIASKMIGIRPTGMTPISYAIMRSLNEDFGNVNGRRSIILISDGIETCGEDPCHVAVRMQQMGVNVKINVIGLGLQDYDANKQLRCVALGTKGQFYTANTAAELANSLNSALAVETKVQGTIVSPVTPTLPALPPQAPEPVSPAPTVPAQNLKEPRQELQANSYGTKPVMHSATQTVQSHQTKLLQAKVPITRKKR